MKRYLLIICLLIVSALSNAQGRLDTLYFDLDTCLVSHPAFAVKMRVLYTPNTGGSKRYIDYNLRSMQILEEGGFSSIQRVGNKVKMHREGKLIRYHENGVIHAEQMMHNGKAYGISKFYDTQGNLEFEMSFKDGILDGVTKYYLNGVLQRSDTFLQGKMNGPSIIYYPNGKKQTEVYYQNDILHGSYSEYYPTGQIKCSGSLVNGAYHGQFRFFNERGTITNTRTAINGQWTN